MESPGAYVTERVWPRPFMLGPVFFPPALPCSGGYHLERGGMPLHDPVDVNCKKGTTTDDCICMLGGYGGVYFG